MGVSQNRLSKTMGVLSQRINEIVHGARRITTDTGVRMSRALNLCDSYWGTR